MTAIRRDTRTPVRTLEIGSLKAEVLEQSNGRHYVFSIAGQRLTVYRHELARLAILAELLHREAQGGADYVAELEAEGGKVVA